MRPVIESLGSGFPELAQHRDDVRRLLEAEEERFSQTLAAGSRRLDDLIERARDQGASSLHAGDVFELHDTHGFPVELTAELAREAGLGIDLEGFELQMQQQRERARAAARRGDGVEAERVARFARSAPASEFVGYGELAVETEVVAVEPVADGLALVKLARSPFYPEGGGQVSEPARSPPTPCADRSSPCTGWRATRPCSCAWTASCAPATSCTRASPQPCGGRRWPTTPAPTCCSARSATISASTSGRRAPPCVRRGCASTSRIRRLSPPTSCARSRTRSTGSVLEDRDLRIFEMLQDEARELGATMLFGEKYGDVVRVVDITGYSMELCGGTHVRSTAAVGPFTILRESSVGQGVRRIEAITGAEALGALRRADRAAKEAAASLRTPPEQLPEAVATLSERVRELEKSARAGGGGGGGPDLSSLTAGAAERGRLKVLVAEAPEGTLGDSLLELADRLRGALGPSAVVLGVRDGERVQLVASMTPEAIEDGLDAAAVIKQIGPIVGGGGGGRPSMARAGGKDASRLDEALDVARSMLSA